MRKWVWILLKFSRQLWFRATLYCVTGIITALVALAIGPHIPDDFTRKIGADAVDGILTILATSMLAVTTFSLTTMVSATAAASSSATPRATKLLIEDSTAQTALSAFLGSFLFSLVGLIALNTGMFNNGGRVVLLAVTLGVIAFIVITLLRWISHLARLGRVDETISRVEKAAINAMKQYRDNPLLGARMLTHIPDDALPIYPSEIGCIEHHDMAALSDVAQAAQARIFLDMRAGGFTVPARPLAWIVFDTHAEKVDPLIAEKVCSAYSITPTRSFQQDPRFGLIVLNEICSRALSPAVNDPGTAIQTIGALVRVLHEAISPQQAAMHEQKMFPDTDEPVNESDQTDDGASRYPRLYLRAHSVADLFEDAFMPIARDGAGMLEVGIKLQKALAALASSNPQFIAAATAMSTAALDRAMEALPHEPDRERLKREKMENHPYAHRMHTS